LPRLVEFADVRGDLHAHSTWSDGTASIAKMAAAALAAGTMPGNEIRERIFPSAIRGGMGLLLRTKRHTATGKQIQVLVAAVNRHMPATPSRCCRRRRGRTRSTFPGGNPGARAMIPHLPPRPPIVRLYTGGLRPAWRGRPDGRRGPERLG
jgi:hypothetical protein